MSISLNKSPFKYLLPCKYAVERDNEIWCENDDMLCMQVDKCKEYKPVDKFRNEVSEQPTEVVELAVYQHFKGKQYRVLCVAEHTETQEKFVVYRALYTPYKTYVRPLEMFTEQVEDINLKYRGPRFKKLL